jgi:NAD(P)H-hydrate epimerase
VPLVIDADGLNSIEVSADDLRKAPSPVVLTPHPGEMRMLLHAVRGLDLSVDDIEKDRLGAARDFAAYTGKVLALKGVPTIVAAPDGRGFINTSGNPGMATGGSGDVLTGVIAAFLGRGIEAVRAAAAGVYLHGLAGDIAAARTGVESLIASDMIDSLPSAFVRLAGSQAEPEA